MQVKNFLKELRDSAERIQSIYTKGSCYRLCVILQTVFPSAKAYWSDLDNHAITEIEGKFYDIGGEISKKYIENKGYYLVSEELSDGYYLLKYREDENLSCSTSIEKYRR